MSGDKGGRPSNVRYELHVAIEFTGEAVVNLPNTKTRVKVEKDTPAGVVVKVPLPNKSQQSFDLAATMVDLLFIDVPKRSVEYRLARVKGPGKRGAE